MISHCRFLSVSNALYRNLCLKSVAKYSCTLHYWNRDNISRSSSSLFQKRRFSLIDPEFNLSNDLLLFNELERIASHYANTLYFNSNDEVINKLKSCQLASEVMTIIDQCESPSREQLLQAVLALRGLQKYFDCIVEITPEVDRMFNDLNVALKSPAFIQLVNSLSEFSSKMDLDEISYCLLYLHRLNVPEEMVKKFITSFENILTSTREDDVSAAALARVFIVIKDFHTIWGYYTLNNLLPLIFRKLDSCTDFETFGKLTICFQKTVPLLNSNLLNKYLQKSRMLLQRSDDVIVEASRVRAVMKTILFLTFKSWDCQILNFEKELFSSICGSLKHLNGSELSILYDIAFSNFQSSSIVEEIEQIINDSLNHPMIDDSKNLYIMSLFPKMKLRNEQKKQLIQFFCEKPLILTDFNTTVNNLYFLLTDIENACTKEYADAYWNRILQYYTHFPSLTLIDKIIWISLRYLSYYYTKDYFYPPFERQMQTYLRNFIFNDKNLNLAPSYYAKAGLILACFQPSLSNFTDPVWNRIVDSCHRLTAEEQLICSFILKLVQKRKQKKEWFFKFLPHVMNIITALNENAFKTLTKEPQISFHSLNVILKAYNHREGIKTSPLFDLIREKLKQVNKEEFSGKDIRECVQNFINISHVEPQLVDDMISYCITKRINFISLYTNLLSYIFNFGYSSKNCLEFVDVTKDLIFRYQNKFDERIIVRSALELSYYNKLPVELTDLIFSVEFLDKLDKNIQDSSNKNFVRLSRQTLMELNRSVCLEYPERDIPWFHEKYCKETLSLDSSSHSSLFQFDNVLESRPKNAFYDDVARKLAIIIPTKNAIESHCLSPYYHKIDFLIHTNRKGEPVDPDSCAPSNLHKIALLLLNRPRCSDFYRGKGKMDLIIRQLEMLDYQTIVVDKMEWNSMCMAEPFAKEDLLSSMIWPTKIRC